MTRAGGETEEAVTAARGGPERWALQGLRDRAEGWAGKPRVSAETTGAQITGKGKDGRFKQQDADRVEPEEPVGQSC